MAAVQVDPDKVHEFVDIDGFYNWLAENHATEREVWIKIHKVKSGLASISPEQAIHAALCWGWIDAIRKSFDEKSFLQRYTPRTPKSVWSKINIDNVARLTAEGRMTGHGLKQVEAAKADGRWDRAYRVKGSEIPEDLQAAIDAEPQAKAMSGKLTAQNRFALIFRLGAIKTDAGRKKKIADLVAMLKRGETFHPQKAK
ncbi:MAG TPA: YdeI/OmpD-associated family protein [Sphingopyxis sp.]|uniref:YdeI/OmpD-associated family protein n=1 Tax=Sphingopyxis sp. TaxID=1908224 RepID=UPI002CCB4D34|nr:YdeI/OmpD-associated family protein [Sphingopyxis sp.]HWW55253.1 YdeI/OmpD-associated family protein [Sphingopyxis sp.]